MARVRLGSGLGGIRVPKPRKLSVVASVCFLLGFSVCLFYALYCCQERYSTAVVVIYTCMVCTYEYVNVRTQVRIMVEQSEMKLVVKKLKSQN